MLQDSLMILTFNISINLFKSIFMIGDQINVI